MTELKLSAPKSLWPLTPKKRWVANWLKRRGYRLRNTAAGGATEWWTRGHFTSGITVTVSNAELQYEAVFRPVGDSDIHVRIYLRDLGTKAAQYRLMEFERIQEKIEALSLAGWP